MQARETIYGGTRMRSRLEARFAQFCDSYEWEWQYEPLCFASEKGQYLPDFYVKVQNEDCEDWDAWVEVKPTLAMARDVCERMEVIRSSDSVTRLVIAVPCREALGSWDRIPEGVFVSYAVFLTDPDFSGWFTMEEGHDGRFNGYDKHWRNTRISRLR